LALESRALADEESEIGRRPDAVRAVGEIVDDRRLRYGGEHDLLEGRAVPTAESGSRAHPQRAGSVDVQGFDLRRRQSLAQTERVEAIAVVAVEPVVRADPNEAGPILREQIDAEIAEPHGAPVVLEHLVPDRCLFGRRFGAQQSRQRAGAEGQHNEPEPDRTTQSNLHDDASLTNQHSGRSASIILTSRKSAGNAYECLFGVAVAGSIRDGPAFREADDAIGDRDGFGPVRDHDACDLECVDAAVDRALAID